MKWAVCTDIPQTNTKTNREAPYNVDIIFVTNNNVLLILSLGTEVKSEQYERSCMYSYRRTSLFS